MKRSRESSSVLWRTLGVARYPCPALLTQRYMAAQGLGAYPLPSVVGDVPLVALVLIDLGGLSFGR